MSDSKYTSFTSNPRVEESYSLFGDESYGEPLVAQHLVVNFTPLQDVDNDFVQRKCCAFWDFVNSRTELQKLLVLPESNVYRKNFEESEKDSIISEVKSLKKTEPVTDVRTAVSMLEIVEEKGLIDRTFEAKLPKSHCSLGSREYHENEATVALAKAQQDEVCICSGSCMMCSKRRPSEASPAAVDLCRKIEMWENKHPESMDPPGHPPLLSRCIMQRKLL